MSDDDGFGNAQQGSTSIELKVETLEEFTFGLVEAGDIEEGFGQFQDHVAGKTFADHDICFIEQEVAAFDITDKMDLVVLFQEGISGLGENIALTFFFPDVEQSDAGVFDAQDVLCIEGTQDRKLIEIFGFTVSIETNVQQDAGVCRSLWE